MRIGIMFSNGAFSNLLTKKRDAIVGSKTGSLKQTSTFGTNSMRQSSASTII
ncbi:7291_t:CDS:2 [Gigaspora margarita]|uniref:7291_t:CDS:1 n=1 Tax=Gigaspora margarita TaxID=4874 RepID=A0ABN7UMP7_GIGMA|nr:7291_t:CDS:2 [Gigaspora margarita]